MAKNNTGGVFLIICGGLLLLISANEFRDLILGLSMTEGDIATNILYALVGILLMWRGKAKKRKDNPKSP
jgi:hypothetical protein